MHPRHQQTPISISSARVLCSIARPRLCSFAPAAMIGLEVVRSSHHRASLSLSPPQRSPSARVCCTSQRSIRLPLFCVHGYFRHTSSSARVVRADVARMTLGDVRRTASIHLSRPFFFAYASRDVLLKARDPGEYRCPHTSSRSRQNQADTRDTPGCCFASSRHVGRYRGRGLRTQARLVK